MKFNKKYNISKEFEELFKFSNKEEEIEHEAKMIMFRFLSELENLNPEVPLKKKELAAKIQISASYITQLFNGDKLINLTTLAKIQDAFDITFEIKAIDNAENYQKKIEKVNLIVSYKRPMFEGYRAVKDNVYEQITATSKIEKSKVV